MLPKFLTQLAAVSAPSSMFASTCAPLHLLQRHDMAAEAIDPAQQPDSMLSVCTFPQGLIDTSMSW
jgi:hypothetical protein